MKIDKKLSTHAEAAKHIRLELKKAFPLIKFSVTSQSYSGGNSIHVEWMNGPTSDMVSGIVSKYQCGHFNGMEDIYENTNRRNDIPQVKYVQVRRNVCENTNEQVLKWLQATHAHFDEVTSLDECNDNLLKHWSAWTAREYIFRVLAKEDLTNGCKMLITA